MNEQQWNNLQALFNDIRQKQRIIATAWLDVTKLFQNASQKWVAQIHELTDSNELLKQQVFELEEELQLAQIGEPTKKIELLEREKKEAIYTELTNYKKQNQELEQQIQEILREKEQLTHQYEELMNQYNEIREQAGQFDFTPVSFETPKSEEGALDNYMADITKAEQTLTHFTAEQEQLQEKITGMDEKIQKLELELAEAQSIKEQIENDYKQEIELLKNENTTLNNNLQLMEEEINILQTEKETFVVENSQIKDEVETLKTQWEETQKIIEEYELLLSEKVITDNRCSELETIKVDLEEQITNKDNQIFQKKELLNQMTQEIEDKNALIETYKELEAHIANMKEAESALTILEDEREQLREERKQLREEIKALDEHIAILEKQASDNHEEVATIKDTVAQKEQIIDDLNTDIENLTQNRSVLADKLILQKEQYEKLSEYYNELQTKYTLVEKETKTYQNTFTNCEKQFREIKEAWEIVEQKFTRWQSIIDSLELAGVEIPTFKEELQTPEIVESKFEEKEPVQEEITNMEAIAKSISEQVSKIGESLAALKIDVAGKDESDEITAIPSTIFIYGGTENIAKLWGDYIETYLNEFSLMHQWVFDVEGITKSNTRGIVFLINGDASKIKEKILYAKENKIPYIEHPISNITRLKIDIFDNFLKPSVQ